MADWSTPVITDLKVNVLNLLKARDIDSISLSESIINPPTGAIRWVTASNKLQRWNGTAWVDLVLAIESGGTGGSSSSAARTALGLGTMATQNSNAVSISGGAISGLSSISSAGNATFSGILTLGSAPTVVSDSSGKVLEAAIADGTILARVGGNETITGVWTFSNTINGNLNGNAATVTDGVYVSQANQFITGRKIFSGAQASIIANAANNLGGIEVYGGGGTNAAFMTFHRPGEFAVYFGLDSDNSLRVGGWSLGPNAYTLLHAGNFNNYAPTKTGTGATGTWPINIYGNAGGALALTSDIVINGVPVNVGSNVTITCAAGTLTGSTLNASVVNSSLTSLGTITNLTVGNGSPTAPSVRFAGQLKSGMYFSGTTAEFGARFDDVDRSVMRTYTGAVKIDFLLGTTIPLELGDSIVYVGPTSPTNLQVRGDITPAVDNTYQIGYSGGRFQEVWSVNGTLQTSDMRHKRSHGTIENPLDILRNVEPLIASWQSDPEGGRFPAFSAQNVIEAVDNKLNTGIVKVDKFDIHAMYGERMVPVLWAIVKELDKRVQELSCH